MGVCVRSRAKVFFNRVFFNSQQNPNHSAWLWLVYGLALAGLLCTAWCGVGLWSWLNRPVLQTAPTVAELNTAPPNPLELTAQLLGAQANGQATPPNVTLAGVMANTAQSKQGAAVLLLEGQPPKAIKLGEEVSPGWFLVELGPSHAVLQNQGVRHRVDLPQAAAQSGMQLVPQVLPNQLSQ